MPEPADEAGPAAAASRLLEALAARGLSLASAESVTGGRFAGLVTSVPGASRSYVGGVVAYTSRLKHELLGVDADLLARHGAVNEAVARAMAEGARRRLGASVAVACTGVAGPDPSDGAPVGTVFLALALAGSTRAVELSLDGDRRAIREATVAAMVDLVANSLP
ncbi:CinA family protein [Propionibacteriaceae bacterium Y1923]|uniref:CinA family protein n=1 Tax=Aestuariimicrobium sp. Y1814 TaxID=3418742 RepID=UPI003C2410E9